MEKAETSIGSTHAQELLSILSDAEAAETAAEFVELYSPEALANGGLITLPLGTKFELRFGAVGKAHAGSGNPDWNDVRRLKLMEIAPC